MSETKWTPGPWQVEPERLKGVRHIAGRSPSVYRNDRILARVSRSLDAHLKDGRCDEAEANARLIAAAPEMAEALKLAREELRLIHMKDRLTTYHPGLTVQIDMVLAKIEGRTP